MTVQLNFLSILVLQRNKPSFLTSLFCFRKSKMTDTSNSVSGNENEQVTAKKSSDINHKRDADSLTLQVAAKRSKLEASNVGGSVIGEEEARDVGPVLDKGSTSYELGHQISNDDGLFFEIEAAAAEDKGSRHNMEDAWVVLLDASMDFAGTLRCAHFAVYDGHGGRLAAEYVQKHLHRNVLSAGLPRELLDVKAAKRAILEGFRKTDESLLQESSTGGWQDGATAVCMWVLRQKVFVANIGDAKAVLARSSGDDGSQNKMEGVNLLKAIVLTREHKAIYPQERARIQKVGGVVSSNGRLQGRLEVSRAFGDRQFKKVGVIATPDIHSFDLTEREHFIILGCDGFWGVFGPSDAVNFVQKLLKEGLSVSAVTRRLVREAVLERRCKDNCTAILTVFKRK